jgi:hypothetical protein
MLFIRPYSLSGLAGIASSSVISGSPGCISRYTHTDEEKK